jgi:predicted esterase YcpF (UPF0227 family)
MSHPRPEDPVIARAVMLRERLAHAADKLESLVDDLRQEVALLGSEMGGQEDGDDDRT